MNESWGRRVREGALLIVGLGMLIVSTANWIVTGEPPDKVIVGAALALLGIIPIVQNGSRP